MKEVFRREFPSDKSIDEDDIESELVKGYYFVKLKSQKNFNLVCKKDAFLQKGCIHVWGSLSVDEFMRFDSIINKFYIDGVEVSMISKETNSTYLIRLTKEKAYYKDIILANKGMGFATLSEKEW